MSTENNKSVLTRWFDAYNKNDLAMMEKLADEYFTSDFIGHGTTFVNLEPGPVGVKKFVRQSLMDSPDLSFTIHDMIAEGDKVVTRFTVNNTDPKTQDLVSLQILSIDRFIDGKIAEDWGLGVPGTWD